ncbi:MAG: hypothetical protein ACRDPR_14995 [Nocardioidaceae bacterium]
MAGLREITESEGTAPGALALAGALALPTPPGVRASVRDLLRGGSVPRYRPERWNGDFQVQSNNNCYNYACDIRNNTYAQPGMGAGLPHASIDCPGETTGAIADGLLSTGAVEGSAGIEFGHHVALVIAPNRDFHWYRHDRDGTWSHKPGGTEATNLDDSDHPITDPRQANRGIYTVFCGFFCVPRGGVRLAGYLATLAAVDRTDDRTVVRLLVFSGRPDPEWVLDPDEEAALLAKLGAARAGTRVTAQQSGRSRLGYRGFQIDRPGRTPGTREVTTVHGGVVSEVRTTGLDQRADDHDIEQDLLEQARARGFGNLL